MKIIEIIKDDWRLEEIKKSKKYKDIDDSLIKKILEENPKKDIKDIKTILHKLSSYNTTKISKAHKLLEQLKLLKEEENKDIEIINQILNTNLSTKERLNFYNELYKSIFYITGEPNKILDIGAGLNPISYVYLGCKPEYYSVDINKADIEIINEFFNIMNINGKAEVLDCSNLSNFVKLGKADVCFMFKFVDIIESSRKGHKFAEEIIKILGEKCKFIVVSFSTKTLSGKNMNFPYRGWIERMLSRISLSFKRLEFDSEIFYIIEK